MPNASLRRYSELDGKTFLVCVGAAKCATSWLHDYLGKLPCVVTSPIKELHFFNAKFTEHAIADMDALALVRLTHQLGQHGTKADTLRQSADFMASVDRAQMIYDDNAYFGHFARLCAPDTRCFADLTPAYSTIGVEGFRHMRSICASQNIRLRVLYLMRDPIDRFWSQIRHLEQMKPSEKPTENWSMALSAPPLLARADYRATVTALETVFTPGELLFEFYETLFEDATLKRLCTFCDAPFAPGAPGERQNETTVTAPIPEDARRALLDQLAPQYAFCHDRFGAAVPASWQA